jgi:hypothetical protein
MPKRKGKQESIALIPRTRLTGGQYLFLEKLGFKGHLPIDRKQASERIDIILKALRPDLTQGERKQLQEESVAKFELVAKAKYELIKAEEKVREAEKS